MHSSVSAGVHDHDPAFSSQQESVWLVASFFLSSYLYLIFYYSLLLPRQIPGPVPAALGVIFSRVSNFLTGIPLVGGKRGVEEPQ